MYRGLESVAGLGGLAYRFISLNAVSVNRGHTNISKT